MNWDEFNEAVNDAEKTLRYADMAAEKAGKMLIGRLRSLPKTRSNHKTLCYLKRELKNFNMSTGQWKD